ncbi:hypothetical protein LNU06_01020 [Campylobacter sp. VicNov18]|uniref:RICIN domain-containing protein n=1 Tax=Campylobacter bilis TaxID=2691918 RepID=UPI00130E3537|nr:toxin [Campylobacter bilis]MPV63250.1 toxin [Campylobacter hepaticus]MBM0636749.1 toxin [Campylobacter bilis]MCC8277320.1 hypothetical protein [Campylobacter bilis]MCC8299063.1 hypothetical protein [Campylobacter bilis]MCC8300229.1 hypothetical protein [Campylobacter bilis]
MILNLAFASDKVLKSQGVFSDYITIMNPAGTILVVSNPTVGNLITGYTLLNSKNFGEARAWRLIEFPNNTVMFKNAKTNTCLSANRNKDLVHFACNVNDSSQFWTLIPYDNKAVKIQNLFTKLCIRSIINQPLKDFDKISRVLLTRCVLKGESNLDQQWYITAPPFSARPLYNKGEK